MILYTIYKIGMVRKIGKFLISMYTCKILKFDASLFHENRDIKQQDFNI